jgi:hypothetical protein
MSTRHRRAAAGGCVNCRFRCQHAMTGLAPTGQARRFWLVTTADRKPPEPAPSHQGRSGRPGDAPGRSVPVLLPMPAVRSAGPGLAGGGLAAPRWPDRPLLRSAPHGTTPHGTTPHRITRHRTTPHRTGQAGRPEVHVPRRVHAVGRT